MAGMGDNPLVGDYTKGISKGREYFVALQRRINAEKANPKVIVSDLQMGLLRELNRTRDDSVARTGLGRFGAKIAEKVMPETHALVPKSNAKAALSKGNKISSLQDLKLLFK